MQQKQRERIIYQEPWFQYFLWFSVALGDEVKYCVYIQKEIKREVIMSICWLSAPRGQ
jgi:hypothetical protein